MSGAPDREAPDHDLPDRDAPDREAHGPRDASEAFAELASSLLHAARWQTTLLVCLTVFATVTCLYLARTYFLPVFTALFFNLLFKPVTRRMKRSLHIPYPVGAMFVLAFFLLVTIGGVYFLAEPSSRWMERAPENLDDASRKISRLLYEPMRKVSDAADSVEKMTDVDNPQSTQKVTVEGPNLVGRMVAGTSTFLSSVFVVAGLLYFLLASGDRLSRSATMLLGRGAARRKALEISAAVEHQVSMYLGVVTLINAGLGLGVGLVLWLVGMPNPALWGVMAMLLNFVPYLGAAAGVVIVTLVGIVTFPEPVYALGAGAAYLTLTAIEGTFVTPTILGDRFRINPVFVFVWLIFCAWLWGAVGALLAVPMLTIVRIVCEKVEALRPAAEILSS